jgi:hypothetical protein
MRWRAVTSPSSWPECAWARPTTAFGMALGALFVPEHFSAASKAKVRLPWVQRGSGRNVGAKLGVHPCRGLENWERQCFLLPPAQAQCGVRHH